MLINYNLFHVFEIILFNLIFFCELQNANGSSINRNWFKQCYNMEMKTERKHAWKMVTEKKSDT